MQRQAVQVSSKKKNKFGVVTVHNSATLDRDEPHWLTDGWPLVLVEECEQGTVPDDKQNRIFLRDLDAKDKRQIETLQQQIEQLPDGATVPCRGRDSMEDAWDYGYCTKLHGGLLSLRYASRDWMESQCHIREVDFCHLVHLALANNYTLNEEAAPRNEWKWKVWVQAHPELPVVVEQIIAHLHSDFLPQRHTLQRNGSMYESVAFLGWGTFTLPLEIVWMEPATGRRGQTLVKHDLRFHFPDGEEVHTTHHMLVPTTSPAIADVDPIMEAARKGDLTRIKQLMEKQDVFVDVRDDFERTALHTACTRGHLPVAEYLVALGANLLARNKRGRTPLHNATFNGRFGVTKWLLRQPGTAIDAFDSVGNTPLHRASWGGHLQIVLCLLEHGANPLLRNRDGLTPMELAGTYHSADASQKGPIQRALVRKLPRAQKPPDPPAASTPDHIAQISSTPPPGLSRSHTAPLSSSAARSSLSSPLLHSLPATQDNSFHVFLSHTGQDETAGNFSAHLHRECQRLGISCFYDARCIPPGEVFAEFINRAVHGCRVFVAILSPAYFRRHWCLHELDMALGAGCKILPVYYGISCDSEIPRNRPAFEKIFLKGGRVDQAEVSRWWNNATVLLPRIQAIHRAQFRTKTADVQLMNLIVENLQRLISPRGPIRESRSAEVFEVWEDAMFDDDDGENDGLELHVAVKYGDKDELRRLLSNVDDGQADNIVNATDNKGRTAMDLAARTGQLGLVETLKQHGGRYSRQSAKMSVLVEKRKTFVEQYLHSVRDSVS